jgi:hypothetical protein
MVFVKRRGPTIEGDGSVNEILELPQRQTGIAILLKKSSCFD